jgi:membrane protein YdbS with pleckstrin-like domain
MIRLTCDNCEQPIEVDDSLAGQKVKCPACGDVNVVPAAGAADRAAAAGLPAVRGPETRVMVVRRSVFRGKPLRFLLLVVVLLAGITGAVYFGVVRNPGEPIGVAASAVVGAIALLTLIGWKLLSLSQRLDITTKRTVERVGILSRATTEIMHKDIRGVQIRQTFAQRLLRVGTICISSAAEDEHEIMATDVPNPDRVRGTIDLYRQV